MDRRIFTTGLLATGLPISPVFADLLSRGTFGSRDAYFERVKNLTRELTVTDPSSPQIRDLAVTLSAALQDFAFNEAAIREDKALPPIGGLQRIRGNETEIPVPQRSTELGQPKNLGDVPSLWFVERVDLARDRTDELVTLIDSEAGLPHDYESAVSDIALFVDSINRPPD